MKRTLIVLSILTAGLLAFAAAAPAVAPEGPPPAPARPRIADTPMGRLIVGQIGRALVLRSELEVSPLQRREIRRILASHRDEIAAAARPLVQRQRALRDAVRADTPDARQIRAAAEAFGKALGDAAVLAGKIHAEVSEVLTPEQRKRIDAFVGERDNAVDRFLKALAGAP